MMATTFNYPDDRNRTAEDCVANSRKIKDAAKFIGIEVGPETNIDICDDGSVYIGLTQVMPAKSIDVGEQEKAVDMNQRLARYGETGMSHIKLSELVELAKKGGVIARAEDSGCEGCFIEVARWCEDDNEWKRFAFNKLFSDETSTAFELCTEIVNVINAGNEGAPLIHSLKTFGEKITTNA